MAVIGVDIGTQSLKAVVTREGGVLGAASQSYDILQPRPGWAEQDPRLWDSAVAKVVPLALERAGIPASEVRCIAVAGQLDGCVAVDADGGAIGNCLVWMDRRAVDVTPKPTSERLKQTGLVFDASHMGAKIRWLLDSGIPPGSRFHQPTSYLVERLCGAYVFDHALASTTMLYDLREADYSDELVELFSLQREALPSIASSDERAGQLCPRGAALCGLPPGIPVAVGTGDDFATLLGSGHVEPGPLLCGLGTAEVVGAISASLCIDDGALVETHGFLDGYFVQNPGWLSGGALRWIGKLLDVESDAHLDGLASCAPPGSCGVLFVPALTGALAPRWQASARGCFYGLSSHHGREHMARAVLEGCAFAMRDVRSRLQSMGLASGEIVLQGGGARSALWAQIRADLCQASVARQPSGAATAMGASLLAEAVIRPGARLRELAKAQQPESLDHTPEPSNSAVYEDAYQRYRLLFDSLEPMF
ncbi:MAG: hypothetical protein GY811_18840 [Myxococcales bacterium]|nr:hypothetical protein [Myxococcales bacterium]